MRATLMYQAGDVRIESIPDATIKQPTDAVIRVIRAGTIGDDAYRTVEQERDWLDLSARPPTDAD